jgi:hypothetical protein
MDGVWAAAEGGSVATGNTAASTSAAPIDIAANHPRGTIFGAGREATSAREAMKVPYFRLLFSELAATTIVADHEIS